VKFLTQGPGQSLGAAALPVPAKMAQAYQSHGRIHGSPGIEAIPSPRPAAVPQGIAYRNTGSPLFASEKAPAVWFPGVYYYGTDSVSRAPVSVISDNQMPMPAVDPMREPSIQLRRPTFLGQTQVQQPWVAPVYPAAGR
jgi:hypothetical protein